MMSIKVYTVFLPSHGHEDQVIGTIQYNPEANCAKLKLHNHDEQVFYSPFAAMKAVHLQYPSAYAD